MSEEFDDRWRGDRQRQPTRREAWQSSNRSTDHRQTVRRVKLLAFGFAGLLIAIGIFFLIDFLRKSNPPGLMTIADNPNTTAAQLFQPYDPYGYASAKWLLSRCDQHKDDGLSPKALQEEPGTLANMDDWIQTLVVSKCNPIVLYFGMTGRVDGSGEPCLVTAAKQSPLSQSIKVSTILEKLNDNKSLNKIQMVLVFDTARSRPDSNHGEIESAFTEAMKQTIEPMVAKSQNLTLILSAESGQRAWESPAWGITPLACFLSTAFYPNMTDDGTRKFDVLKGFEALERDVKNWSQNNRPTEQTPILMPPTSAWNLPDTETRRKGFREKPFYARTQKMVPIAASPKPSLDPFDLAIWQKKADEFGILNRSIPVNAYTPAAWRQFRELLLRYEYADQARDTIGRVVLERALKEQAEIIQNGLNLEVESKDYNLTHSIALGKSADHFEQSKRVAMATDLKTAAVEAAKINLDRKRPVELHLPVMLQYFTSLRSPTPSWMHWKKMVDTRRKAEQAVVGLNGDQFPYAEQLWSSILKENVLKGDDARRRAEDELHLKETDLVQAGLKIANDHYDTATKRALPIQKALTLRNRAVADLPFWGRWAVESSREQDILHVKSCWKLTHQLNQKIIKTLPLEETTKELEEELKKLDQSFEKMILTISGNDLTVSPWNQIQPLLLLPPPMLSAEKRQNLIRLSQAFTANDPKRNAAREKGEIKIERNEIQIRKWRSEIAASSLDQVDKLGLDKVEPQPGSKEWLKALGEISDRLSKHQIDRAKANELTFPDDTNSSLAREWTSRLLLQLPALPESAEPAVQNGRTNWANYLEAMALRIANDHWYDENNNDYYKKIGTAMLGDAQAITMAKDLSPVRKEAEQLLAFNPLNLQWTDPKSKNGSHPLWTNEKQRAFPYQLSSCQQPGGRAFVWPTPEKFDPFRVAITSLSQLINVDTNQPISQVFDLECPLEHGVQSSIDNLNVSIHGYFRGRHRELKTQFDFRRNPDYIATEIRDPERRSLLAIRTENEFDAGSLAIVLDFSGSMAFSWDGNEDKSNGRVRKMLDTLDELLKQLPPSTKLQIRYFVEVSSEQKYLKPKTNLTAPLTAEKIDTLIQELRKIEPKGSTPLIKAIETAVKNDLQIQNANAQQEHIVVALTDGTDNSLASSDYATIFQNKYAGEKDDQNYSIRTEEKLRNPDFRKMNNSFILDTRNTFQDKTLNYIRDSRSKISVHVILFGRDKDAKANEAARTIFSNLNSSTYTPNGAPADVKEHYGRFYEATDIEQLKETVNKALRPKPRLTKNQLTIPDVLDPEKPTYIPPSGLPANRFTDGVGQFWWYGYLHNNRNEYFDLRFGSKSQQTQFDNGLNLFLKLNSKAEFEREIYFRDVLKAAYTQSNDRWHLAAIEQSQNSNQTRILAALESTTDLNELKPIVPQMTWWDMTTGVAAKRFNGPVQVRNVVGYQAPCWQIIGQGVPHNGKYGLIASAFRQGDLAHVDEVSLGRRDNLQSRLNRAKGVVVHASIEPYRFTKGMESQDTSSRIPLQANPMPVCLVVRMEDPDGRRLRLKWKSKEEAQHCSVVEHQYFYERDSKVDPPKVLSYTAIFGPLDSILPNDEITLQIYDLSEPKDAIRLNGVDLQNRGVELTRPVPQRNPVSVQP